MNPFSNDLFYTYFHDIVVVFCNLFDSNYHNFDIIGMDIVEG